MIVFSISHAENISFEKQDNIQLYYGINALKEEFFCYIRCNKTGYKKMQEDYLNKASAKPEEYGQVIYKDYLAEPDDKAKEFLEKYLQQNS